MHQAGVYPSGWRPSGISLSVYLSPSQTALFASQCTSLAVAVAPRGGATPRFWTPTTPPTNCWPEAPWGGGGGGGGMGGGWVKEGRMGGV